MGDVPHPSDSTAQALAQMPMIAAVNGQLGLSLVADVPLPSPPAHLIVTPDAVDLEAKVVMEIYARIGTLRPGHKKKVQADVLKLALIERHWGRDWRKIMCFASEEAARFLRGDSWAAHAARVFEIEPIVAVPPHDIAAAIVEAQRSQER